MNLFELDERESDTLNESKRYHECNNSAFLGDSYHFRNLQASRSKVYYLHYGSVVGKLGVCDLDYLRKL